jgi:hypothetical protein
VLWYLILPTSVVAFCGLLGWIAWLIFNAWAFVKTGDVSVFEKTSPVAKSFRRPSASDTVKELGTLSGARERWTQRASRRPPS